eukprot:scaffold9142_cov65-Phaeocystis_antarctica.AAC.2
MRACQRTAHLRRESSGPVRFWIFSHPVCGLGPRRTPACAQQPADFLPRAATFALSSYHNGSLVARTTILSQCAKLYLYLRTQGLPHPRRVAHRRRAAGAIEESHPARHSRPGRADGRPE